MEKLGSIDGIPVYITSKFNNIRLNSDNDTYIIFNRKVYQSGRQVGIYNKKDQSIKWYMGDEKVPAADDDVASGYDWDELIKPIDDMITEMLEREL